MSSIVSLTEDDSDSTGVLIAARHARERELFPILPDRFEDPARAAELVLRDQAHQRTGSRVGDREVIALRRT